MTTIKTKKTLGSAKFEAKNISLRIENINGVHTHERNGETFTGKQKDCLLCKTGSQLEKTLGAIGL